MAARLLRRSIGMMAGLAWVVALTAGPLAQAPATDRAATEAAGRRVAERMRTLQREADRLAAESRTLVGDLRKLEIERDLAAERAAQAEEAAAGARAEFEAASARLEALERQRVASLPDLRARFVELYKHGRGGYARMLAGVADLRETGRAMRAIASLAHLNERRIEEHHRMLEATRGARAAADQGARALQAKRDEAAQARAAAERAVVARVALLRQIDQRRDLNAQLAGELLVAQQRLDAAARALRAGRAVEPVAVPLAPFRGALEWPVVGPVTGRFGQPNRMAGSGVRNGIEIAAPAGTPVQAVHSGVVGFADAFTGYGTLVIVDHGANHFSLYGYLETAAVERGERVAAGAELGRVGFAPLGDPALYFEVRIDGRSVDPVQWLRKR